MRITSLPEKANLDYLKKLAKRILRAFREGDREIVALVSRFVTADEPTLRQAQYALARAYGFNSWADLALFAGYGRGGARMTSRINWFWIPARDLGRAAEFYRRVLACEVWPHAEDGFAVFQWEKGEISGGIDVNLTAPSKEGVRVLLNCEGRLDAAIGAVRQAGGKVISVCGLGDFGIQAVVEDTEGNHVHLHSFSKTGAAAEKEVAAIAGKQK